MENIKTIVGFTVLAGLIPFSKPCAQGSPSKAQVDAVRSNRADVAELQRLTQHLAACARRAPGKCSAKHDNRWKRAKRLATKGDTNCVRSAAGHAVGCALDRYRLRQLVSQNDILRAQREMYNFLKWKYGTPTLCAARWLHKGYRYFDTHYADEAAAMLLGVLRFDKVKPDVAVPGWLRTYLKAKLGTQSAAGTTAFLTWLGVPAPVATSIGAKIGDIVSGTLDRTFRGGIFWPKKYDVDDKLIHAVRFARQRCVPVSPVTRRLPRWRRWK